MAAVERHPPDVGVHRVLDVRPIDGRLTLTGQRFPSGDPRDAVVRRLARRDESHPDRVVEHLVHDVSAVLTLEIPLRPVGSSGSAQISTEAPLRFILAHHSSSCTASGSAASAPSSSSSRWHTTASPRTDPDEGGGIQLSFRSRYCSCLGQEVDDESSADVGSNSVRGCSGYRLKSRVDALPETRLRAVGRRQRAVTPGRCPLRYA